MARSALQQFPLKAGEGAYHVVAVSGLTAGIAAGTATAGHVFAVRWAPAPGTIRQKMILQRLSVRMRAITDFTATQEMSFNAVIARAYTASHTGGTAIDLTTNVNTNKLKTAFPTSAVADMRISNTAELTAGTHTLDANPFLYETNSDLANAATVQKGQVGGIYFADYDVIGPFEIAANEGIVVRNGIAQGAGGTVRIAVELDWFEVEKY